MSANGEINPKNGKPKGQRFGIEKPAIPGPGRPRLPEGVKERRALLRKGLEDIGPDAIELLRDVINDPRAENKDKLRAAEISLSHSLPRQEEVTLDDERPLREVPADQLESKLADIRSSRGRDSGRTGEAA